MKPHGTYKLSYRNRGARSLEFGAAPLATPDEKDCLDLYARSEERVQRILGSLRDEIVEGGGGPSLRIRRIVDGPREIYRLELELPDLGYQRTTFLDRDALEELLEEDDVRDVVENGRLGL